MSAEFKAENFDEPVVERGLDGGCHGAGHPEVLREHLGEIRGGPTHRPVLEFVLVEGEEADNVNEEAVLKHTIFCLDKVRFRAF